MAGLLEEAGAAVTFACPFGAQAGGETAFDRRIPRCGCGHRHDDHEPPHLNCGRCDCEQLVIACRDPEAEWIADLERQTNSDGSRGSFGFFQVGAIHRSAGESVSAFMRRMFDPYENVRKAYRMSKGGTSWGPWSCRP